MAFERGLREQRQPGFAQPAAAAKLGKIDDGSAFDHASTQPLEKILASHHGAAGGDQVIDQHHAVAAQHRVGVDLDRGRSVLQVVRLLQRGVGQFALLANGHEADVELIGQHRADDEAARIHPRDGGRPLVEVAVHELIDQHPKRPRVLQQRCDVAKLNAGRRPIGHGANV